MTLHRPAADSEGAAPRASDDPSAAALRARESSAPLTRREARALERAAAGVPDGGAVRATGGVPDGPAMTPAVIVAAPTELPSRRDLRAASRSVRRPARPATRVAPSRVAPTRVAPTRVAPTRVAPTRVAPTRVAPSRVAPTRTTPTRTTPTRPRPTVAQRTTRLGVVGAMLFVGATIVSTSVPANAYFVDTPEHVAVKLAAAVDAGTTVGGVSARGQKFIASDAASAEDLGRDGYSVTSAAQGIKNTSGSTFTNDSTAAVQWPFAVGVPISSGFGARKVANCSFCSTFHQGLDFTPGAGAPIQIIADGTVSKVDQGSGALGYNVWIEHTIKGQKVTSVYAHMKAGSIRVVQGQTVKVGQIVGLVGSTGNSTGAHLHFEIHLSGVPVDPYPWLEANAGA